MESKLLKQYKEQSSFQMKVHTGFGPFEVIVVKPTVDKVSPCIVILFFIKISY